MVNGKHSLGLLDALADVRFGMTHFTSGGSGHRKRGDELAALFEPDVERLGSNGSVILTSQGRAAQLFDEARNTLTTIVRDMLETRGVDVLVAFRLVDKRLVGPLLPGWRRAPADWRPTLVEIAKWLADNTHSLACDESAGQWKAQADDLVRKIKRVIDRPPAPKFCGQCDKMIDRKICGLMLYARPDAIEVTCSNSACRTTHNIEQLYNRWRNSIDHQILPRERIIGNQRTDNPELYDTGIMGTLEEFVSWQQFNRWVRERHIKPIHYVRPNGRIVFFRRSADDTPHYRVGDVRNTLRRMANSKAKAKAGA